MLIDSTCRHARAMVLLRMSLKPQYVTIILARRSVWNAKDGSVRGPTACFRCQPGDVD